MPYDHIAQVRIRGTIHGQQTNNVVNFGSEGAVPPDNSASLQGLVAAVSTAIITGLLPALSAEWKLGAVSAKMLAPTMSDEVTQENEQQPGTAVGEALPSYSAALIQVRTGLGGRSKRGKMFIAGVPEGGQTGSFLTPAEIVLLQAYTAALKAAFITGVSGAEWRIGVLSRKLSIGNPPNYPAGFTPATDLVVTPLLAIQSSRKVGRGV